jgi:hypothetical protein
MSAYVYGDPFTLPEYRDADFGVRPSFKKLLKLIDTSDPAWPHTAAALREMTEAGIEVDEAAFATAVKLGAHRLAELDATKRACRRVKYETPPLESAGSIVYYIRRGRVIKIGTTVVPVMRFTNLMPDEILAFEPGTVKVERMRHRQFQHLRCRGEHFRPEPELLEHARQLRRIHGNPDPSWPTVATLEKAARGREWNGSAFAPPESASGRSLTAAEAETYLGIRKGTLSGWVFRRVISPAGRNERGHQVFYLEHLLALHDRPAAVRGRNAQSGRRMDNGTTR